MKIKNLRKKTIIYLVGLLFILIALSPVFNANKLYDAPIIIENTNTNLFDLKVVSIAFKQQSELNKLMNQHLDILNIKDSEITAYVSSIQLSKLYELGFNPKIIFQNIQEMNNHIYGSEILEFHNYAQITQELQNIANTYPDISQLYDLGHSVQGRVIWGLKITDNPTIEENEPEVRICGNHHGNEIMSVELPLLMAWHLVQNYSINPNIEELINNREIWIIPMVNPDGREMGTRYNAHGVDLNRDYGYVWGGEGGSPSPFSQPETQAIRNNALDNNFVLSLSYHTTEAIVNYIWNYKGQPVADHNVVVQLSQQYGSHNGYWVVEGYDWYQTRGDTNDFSYGCRGDIDWTIETQNSNIPVAWNLHRDAMLEIIDAANMGLSGIVRDEETGNPLAATIWVEEAYWPCFTDPKIGDYHKVLLPGSYTVHFQANGYEEQVHNVIITDETTVLNVALSSENNYYAYQVTMCDFYDPYNYPNNFQNNPTEGISALGPPDGICASLGVGGYIVLDMGSEGIIIDHENESDFKIFEGDTTQDGYTVYVSSNWSGPWVNMGQAMGSAEFDLANISVESAQFIKIVDDNNGNPNELNPGVDIDAVQHLVYEIIPPNNPPNTPEINGSANGKVGVQYTYDFLATDPDWDDVYYFIFWGDGNNSGWLGPFNSSIKISKNYSWNEKGTYIINAKAKDVYGDESNWATFTVTMPRDRTIINSRLNQLLERFPLLKKLLFLIKL